MIQHHSPAWILTALAVLSEFPLASGNDQTELPSFRNDVMAVLSRAGCNAGTCHGNASGKGGFGLSLRGQEPAADYRTLTRQAGSRRVSLVDPDSSLLLLKATMKVPHQGGRRFSADSREFRILRDWIGAGMVQDGKQTPRLTELTATPSHATTYAPAVSVQLRVTARFSDGSQRDVTGLTVFESSALFVSVSRSGTATADHAGQTVISARYLDRQIPIRLEFVPHRPNFVSTAPQPSGFIDTAVFAQLERLHINPSEVCDDTTFVRRVHLDVTGLLPTAEKARAFVTSSQPDKRRQLIDELLAAPEFNDLQALRWADLLRVEEKTLDQTGVAVFHAWIRQSFAEKKPLTEFAGELLASRGSTYTVPATNFYRSLRTPSARAEAAAQLFLGIRLQCAKCHNHPFDRWTQQNYYDWSNFFARIDYKIIENKRRDKYDKHEFVGEQIIQIKSTGDVRNPHTDSVAGLRFPGESGPVETTVDRDRLQQVAAWISSPDNSRFAATQANRIWYQLMGQGVVEPVDDFRVTNPPVNPELLASLEKSFVDGGFRVRPLMRSILNSTTYQLSSTPNVTNRNGAGLFARIEPRRLTAEQTLDAVCQVLDVPAVFGNQKAGTKAVQIVGVRNGGHRYSPPEIGDRFLALFGKPGRQLACECERIADTTLAQTFELVSGQLIDEFLRHGKGRIEAAVQQNSPAQSFLETLYWSAVCRSPSAEETEAAAKHIAVTPDRRKALEDIAWAVLNSNEFLLRR
ncbi:MAG: DUF1549 domain-containing protein [Planctomycetaceae bacterium]